MWLTSLTAAQRRVLLDLAHNVVVSDGLVDPNEEFMLDSFKREMELSAKIEPSYLDINGVDRVFDTRRSRTIALLNLLRLSYVDGAFEIEEECFLKEVSRAFGVTDSEFMLLDNWVRRLVALEQEARGFM
jgi:tellurite resistance protein